jgi:RNA-directed DNA polymerase
LGIPTVEDRVVQTALRLVLEPIFERDFAAASYGFRPGRGCKDALRQVDQMLRGGSTWVVDVDLKSYFDSIPHQRLLRLVEAKVADGCVLELLAAYLQQDVLEGLKSWRPPQGTPQGAVISPLLANIYLDPLDQLLTAAGLQLVRYADDLVILCRSQAAAVAALQLVQQWVEAVGLRLHPEKTTIVDASQRGGFDFLGYHFERGYRWPRRKSQKRFKDAIRAKSKRTRGDSLEMIIADLNKTIRGWFEYFKHSHRTTFPPLDGWIRMRLRSILRRRQGGRGRGRGSDHQRWPIAFFADLGLFSLVAAHALACQSARR